MPSDVKTAYRKHIDRRNEAGRVWAEEHPKPVIGDYPLDQTRAHSQDRRAWHIALGEFGREWDAANPAPAKTEGELEEAGELRALGARIAGVLGHD